MPQIILECSKNVIEQNLSPLLLDIHKVLTEHLPTQLDSCKTRVMRHDVYLVGDGTPEKAFVHLSISVLSGRSTETLNHIALLLKEKLEKAFQQSIEKLNLKISIAIQNLPEVYIK